MGFGGSEGVAGVLHDPCFFLAMLWELSSPLCIVFTTHAAAATPHASGAQDKAAATPTPRDPPPGRGSAPRPAWVGVQDAGGAGHSVFSPNPRPPLVSRARV